MKIKIDKDAINMELFDNEIGTGGKSLPQFLKFIFQDGDKRWANPEVKYSAKNLDEIIYVSYEEHTFIFARRNVYENGKLQGTDIYFTGVHPYTKLL